MSSTGESSRSIAVELALLFLRELPTAPMAVGIVLISLGIVSIAFVQRRKHPRAAAYWACAGAS